MEHEEQEEACLMFHNSYDPCAYYVQSPSTLSHANSASAGNNSGSPTHFIPNKNADVSRFSTLSRYSSSRGSNNSFLHLHDKKINHVDQMAAVNRLIIIDHPVVDHDDDDYQQQGGWWWSFSLALLVFYIATKPPPPQFSIKGPKLYAQSSGSSKFELEVGTRNKPMYGAGTSMEDLLESGMGLPLLIRLKLRSNFRVVWNLIKPSFNHHAHCHLLLLLHPKYDHNHPTQLYNITCTITTS
ncbi:hypothetical protein COLO4_04852 [Corchorus olitorius]|uniref:Uncharacterized protein n=1 Tax=Corchorus olitorius TaxID=93759 RepID=A0A1R3KSM0_9ROSI|nr:hypothetical protein COLO4_04852 [Corchorus olitorius]